MSTKIPVVRSVSWLMLIPSLLVLWGSMALSVLLFWDRRGLESLFGPIALGVFAYLAYSLGSRYILSRHHIEGWRLVKQGQYEQAIAKFEQSHAFSRSIPGWTNTAPSPCSPTPPCPIGRWR
jgi:hypothetical protein